MMAWFKIGMHKLVVIKLFFFLDVLSINNSQDFENGVVIVF